MPLNLLGFGIHVQVFTAVKSEDFFFTPLGF